MSWMNAFKYGFPIVGLVLAFLGVSDFNGIQSGAYGADFGNYAIFGGKGIGSIVAIALSMWASYKTTGKVPVDGIAEIGALQTLWYTLASEGDKDGLELLGPLTEHIVASKSAKAVPKIDNALVDQLATVLSKRLGVQ